MANNVVPSLDTKLIFLQFFLSIKSHNFNLKDFNPSRHLSPSVFILNFYRYRKFNLFNEDVQVTDKPDLVTFRTDFNVTFGISICFDLMFYWPPVALIERGIRNFVYPTMWFSELPYLSGKKEASISFAIPNNSIQLIFF